MSSSCGPDMVMSPPNMLPSSHMAQMQPQQGIMMQPGQSQHMNTGPQQPQMEISNGERILQMLMQRQETIKGNMRDPNITQQRFQQLQMELQNTIHEINTHKQMHFQQQQQQFQQQHHMQYMSQNQNQMSMGPQPQQQNPPNAPPQQFMDMGPQQTQLQHAPASIQAWQHNSYMVDSGINSNHSTAPPSLCSSRGTGLEDDDADSLYGSQASWKNAATPMYPNACLTPDQIGGTINNGYFEPMSCETAPYPSPQQFDPNQGVQPQMMMQGVQQQNQQPQRKQVPGHVIQQIAMMLEDSDPVVVLKAAETAQHLAKATPNRSAIISNNQMIASLVNALHSGNEDIQRCAAGTLHDLSQQKQGLLAIFKCGGIPALIALLQSPREAVLFYAITTLHNLLLHQEGAKSAVTLAGGISILVSLLKNHSNVKFLAITTDCLKYLAYANPANKEEILKANGPLYLVQSMNTYEYEKLLWTTSRLLKVLSVCPQNKQAIVAAGGIQCLANQLRSPSDRLVQNCLWTLRNLSDISAHQDNMGDLLQKLIPFLKNDSSCGNVQKVTMTSCAVGIISNLLCNNANNKCTFVQLGGVQALLTSIHNAKHVDDVIEPAVCALRHVTSRHPLCQEAQNVIRGVPGALACVMNLLEPPPSGSGKWPVLKAVVGLIRNMTLSPQNLPELYQCGVVPRMVGVVRTAHADFQRRATAGQEYRLDGVKVDDIVEGAIGALHAMTRSDAGGGGGYRAALCALPQAVNLLVMLLGSSSKGVLRVTCAILGEIAKDPEGAEKIRDTANLRPLSALMKSSDPQIAESANVLFQNLTQKLSGGGGGSLNNPQMHHQQQQQQQMYQQQHQNVPVHQRAPVPNQMSQLSGSPAQHPSFMMQAAHQNKQGMQPQAPQSHTQQSQYQQHQAMQSSGSFSNLINSIPGSSDMGAEASSGLTPDMEDLPGFCESFDDMIDFDDNFFRL